MNLGGVAGSPRSMGVRRQRSADQGEGFPPGTWVPSGLRDIPAIRFMFKFDELDRRPAQWRTLCLLFHAVAKRCL